MSLKIKGELYKKAEDFIVREIHRNNKICSIEKDLGKVPSRYSKPYVYATLVKKNISTFEACNIFAKNNNIDYGDISFCGLKDTLGLTSQLICIKNRPSLKIKKTRFRNFFLKEFTPSDKNLSIGDHRGNSFVIRIRNINLPKGAIEDSISNFKNFTVNKGLPNIYGCQRFGIRQNNHLLGKLLLKGRYEGFIFHFLTHSKNESPAIKASREKIRENFKDWKKCFEIIKKYKELSDEKTLILDLLEGTDYITAIKKNRLFNFFVHGYSSYLFNLALFSFLKKSYENIKIEKIGKNSKLDKLNRSLYEPILKKEKVSIEDFNKCPFDIKGHSRNSLFYPKKFDFEIKPKAMTLSFDLGKGEYASNVLDCLIDSDVVKLN